MPPRRWSAALMAALLWAVLLPACAPTQAPSSPASPGAAPAAPAPAAPKPEKTRIKLGLAAKSTSFLPAPVADTKGFWKQEGLEVELVQFAGGSQQLQAIMADAIDVGIGSVSEPVQALGAGRKLIIFWGENNSPAWVWYAHPSIRTPQDLKGKKIGISRIGSLTHHLSMWAVRKAGLDPQKDVQYVQVGNQPEAAAALKAGQIDATPLTPPFTLVVEKEGFKPIIRLTEFMPEFQYQVVYAKDTFLKTNPETTRALIRGFIRSVRFMKTNREESINIIMKFLGSKEEERPLVAQAFDFFLPGFREDGQLDLKSIDLFLQFHKESGDIKEIPPYESFIDFSFIEYFKKNPVR